MNIFERFRKNQPQSEQRALVRYQAPTREFDIDPERFAANPGVGRFIGEFLGELTDVETFDVVDTTRLTNKGGERKYYTFYFAGTMQAHHGNEGLRVVGAAQYGQRRDFSTWEAERRVALDYASTDEPVLELFFYTKGDWETASEAIRKEQSFIHTGFTKKEDRLTALMNRRALATATIEVEPNKDTVVVNKYSSERRHPSSILIEDVVEEVRARIEASIDPKEYKTRYQEAKAAEDEYARSERARVRALVEKARQKELEGPKPGSGGAILVA